ncbi:MAG: HipA domain-containing protein, partial [Firmicutes bacterium]|nr:HipA domain-containing protein [Bacillota bacterium]
MKTLNISIEINGEQIPVGAITGLDSNDAVFSYDTNYIAEGYQPISISLPLQEKPFTAYETKNFFEGLLPEGFARKTVSEWLHAPEDDYLVILRALGEECLGAIRVFDEKEKTSGYKQLELEEVKALAREGISKSTDILVKSHLSLTGASGKVGLYYDEENDLWYMPKGLAPSTHIVKQSHIRLDNIVTNEQLAMTTAKGLGIDVPTSFIINTGKGKDEDVLFATKRYDRIIPTQPSLTDGLPTPRRLHQEDFAQTLGIPAERKYEQEGQNYLKRIFQLIRNYSSDPISDQLKMWDLLIFDYLIGNTDNHIKNISLLYSADMRNIRLAPAYDILSTCIYKESSRYMAIGIAGMFDIDQISMN